MMLGYRGRDQLEFPLHRLVPKPLPRLGDPARRYQRLLIPEAAPARKRLRQPRQTSS